MTGVVTNANGFSLLEVIVALTVAGAIAGLGVDLLHSSARVGDRIAKGERVVSEYVGMRTRLRRLAYDRLSPLSGSVPTIDSGGNAPVSNIGKEIFPTEGRLDLVIWQRAGGKLEKSALVGQNHLPQNAGASYGARPGEELGTTRRLLEHRLSGHSGDSPLPNILIRLPVLSSEQVQ